MVSAWSPNGFINLLSQNCLNIVQDLIRAIARAEPLYDKTPVFIFKLFQSILVDFKCISVAYTNQHHGIIICVMGHFNVHVISKAAKLISLCGLIGLLTSSILLWSFSLGHFEDLIVD